MKLRSSALSILSLVIALASIFSGDSNYFEKTKNSVVRPVCKECVIGAGLSKEDVTIIMEKGKKCKEFYTKSQKSKQVQALSKKLLKEGFQILGSETQVSVHKISSKSISLGKKTKKKLKSPISVNQVEYNLFKNGKKVGAMFYIIGKAKDMAIAFIKIHDKFYSYISQSKEVNSMVIDRKGKVLFNTMNISSSDQNCRKIGPKKVTCKEVCGVICGAGWGAHVGRCTAGCVSTGPSWPWCSALCLTLVGLGCLFGCDAICSVFEG